MGLTRKVRSIIGNRGSKTREAASSASVADTLGAAEVELAGILRDVRAFIRETPGDARLR